MRVRFVASDLHGGGHLRSIWPAKALSDIGYEARANPWWPRPNEYDTVVIHRPLAKDNHRRIARYRSAGLRVLIDEDDDLTCIPETNPSRGFVNQRLHDEAIEQADGLVVSTPRLIEVYGHLNPSHWVCRNYLPAAVGDIRSYLGRGARPVTVGWTGTMAVHEHDLLWLRPHAKRALAGCALQIVGDIKCFGALDADATWHHHPYQDDIYALYSLMSRCDIGIVPLEPIAFNLSKSWLKAIEFMSVGVPVVATNLPEQAALIDDGVNGFLVDEPAEFADRVQWLATHPVERAEFGVAARKKAQTLALEQHVAEWDAVLRRDPAPPEGGT